MTTAPTPRADELHFDVDGMTCAHCERAIDGEVRKLANVSSVDVDLDAALVTVRGEELAEQVVRDAILLAGYEARLR
ncbi:MAG: putative metal binding protein [Thermoleophilia bacterium]|nr:putative metal binding protein [Thermoleophilia bacterium]